MGAGLIDRSQISKHSSLEREQVEDKPGGSRTEAPTEARVSVRDARLNIVGTNDESGLNILSKVQTVDDSRESQAMPSVKGRNKDIEIDCFTLEPAPSLAYEERN